MIRRRPGALLAAAVALVGGCRLTMFDVVTSERLVRVPEVSGREFTVETGAIDLPASLGADKIVDSATLNLTAANLNAVNPVTVSIAVADSRQPNAFGPVTTFSLAAGEMRDLAIVQREAADALVRAVQSEAINVRFESHSPEDGIGEIEFRFTVRVRAHKDTPGTGPGTLLFY